MPVIILKTIRVNMFESVSFYFFDRILRFPFRTVFLRLMM
jgi:hypothetical protein